MEYANRTVYSITKTKVLAHEPTTVTDQQEPLTWCACTELKQVAEYSTKKGKTPQSIAALESAEMIFIGYKNSCSTLGPTLNPIHGLSMRDVNFLLTQGDTVVAFTSSAIRIMTAQNSKLELRKTIDHAGVCAAAIAGRSLLVATQELYELIDLTIDSKIPLFPTPQIPLVAQVNSSEFLVVQGGKSDEPAMGLMVKFTGEATRQPIMWDSYPLQVHIDGQFVVALLEQKLTVHSLTCQELVKEWPLAEIWPHHDSQPKLAKTYPFGFQIMDELVGPLNVASSTALYHQQQVQWLVPPAQIAAVQARILKDERIDLEDAGLTTLEKEYAQTLICLRQLETAIGKLPVASLQSVIMYIFGDSQDLKPPFPGLENYINTLKSLDKTKAHLDIYCRYLQSLPATPEVEKIVARLLTGEELVEYLINAKTGKQLAKSLDNTEILQEYYQRTHSQTDLLDLWYRQITANPKYAKKLVEYLACVDDKELVWSEAIKLIKVVPQTGVQIFTRKAKCQFDPEEVLETLKSIEGGSTSNGSGGVAWRIYLKHLVYSKKRKVFAQELVMVVVQDLIDLYAEPDVAAAVEDSYRKYRGLGWPKRPYFHFLQAQPEKSRQFEQFVDLELEFATLVKDGSDMAPLISIIDEHAPQLYVERCAVYRKLGLHNQCLDFLVKDITDYVAAIWYCLYDSNGKPLALSVQQDLAKYTLKLLMAENAPPEVISEHLEKQKRVLDLEYVVSSVPSDTKLSSVGAYLAWHFEKLRDSKQFSQLARALTMGEAKWSEQAFKDLGGHNEPNA